MTSQEDFLKAYEAGELVFFAGAGASYDSGAAMPSAVLKASAQLFLPAGPLTQLILEAHNAVGSEPAGIQPELFYQHLLSLVPDRSVLSLWRVLSPIWLQTQGEMLRPNANHFALAGYAARTGLPLFTTNFDDLFERAADALGFEVEVYGPGLRESDSPDPAVGKSGTLRLFKLHGSIVSQGQESLQTLATTMQGISAVNLPMLDLLRRCFADHHPAFLGYSGCDIDYFPALAGFTLRRGAFWFTPGGDAATVAHADRIHAAKLPIYPSELFRGHDASLTSPPTKPDTFRLIEYLKGTVSTALTDEQRQLFLAMCLNSIGRNDEAYAALQFLSSSASSLSTKDRIAADLLQSRVSDCISLYDQALGSAKQAERKTLEALRRSEIAPVDAAAFRARATYHRAMAKQQAIGPNISYGDAMLDWHPSFTTMLGQLLLGFASAVRLSMLRLGFREELENEPDVRVIMADHAINDHLMMMLGRLITVLSTANIRRVALVRVLLDGMLAKLERRALKSGDYFVFAGSEKYRRLLKGSIGDQDDASETYGLLRDPLNYALVQRTTAVSRLEKGDRNGAAKHFRAAADAAKLSGSKATELKALVGLLACRQAAPLDRTRLREVGPLIEGPGYSRYWREQLAPALQET